MKKLIVCPLPLEVSLIRKYLESKGFTINQVDLGWRAVKKVEELDWCLAIGGHGKVDFALSCQEIIERIDTPALLVCAGSAGALSPDVGQYDVVVGEATIEHDYNLKFVQRPRPRFEGSKSHIAQLTSRSFKEFKVHKGVIASGDEDIISQQRRQEVRELTDGLAVAWEGAGGARVARKYSMPFVEVRALTDLADQSAPKDFKANLEIAMAHLTEVLIAGL